MDEDPIQKSEDLFAHIFEVAGKWYIAADHKPYFKSINGTLNLFKWTHGSHLRQDWSTFARVSTFQSPRAIIIVYLGYGMSSVGGNIFSSVIISSIHSIRVIM